MLNTQVFQTMQYSTITLTMIFFIIKMRPELNQLNH